MQSSSQISPNSFSRFSGKPISDVLIIFAGTARLSITAREARFRTLSVDKTCDRRTGAHIAIFDLAKRDDVESLKQLIFDERFNIAWIHFAPACGTCSRAREKKLPSLEAQGIADPKSLRTDKEPVGFSWLSGVDKIRIDAANLTYLHTCELIEWAFSFNKASSLENPAKSIFWLIPCVLSVIQRIGGYETLFHNWCHGGLRRKLTKWWDTRGVFDELAAVCENDGSHQHLDWKPVTSENKLQYPTASEAAYPLSAISKIGGCSQTAVTWCRCIGATKSPRADLEHYIECYIKPGDDTMLNSFLSQCPKGSRTTNRRCLTWGEVRVDSGDKQHVDKVFLEGHMDLECRVEKVSVGIPRTPIDSPVDFCNRSFLAGHPRSIAVHLSQQVQDGFSANFFDEPHIVAKKRAVFFAKWSKRASDLKGRLALNTSGISRKEKTFNCFERY